jgi:hypothetical protein
MDNHLFDDLFSDSTSEHEKAHGLSEQRPRSETEIHSQQALQSVSTDFVLLAPTFSRGAGDATNDNLQNTL